MHHHRKKSTDTEKDAQLVFRIEDETFNSNDADFRKVARSFPEWTVSEGWIVRLTSRKNGVATYSIMPQTLILDEQGNDVGGFYNVYQDGMPVTSNNLESFHFQSSELAKAIAVKAHE